MNVCTKFHACQYCQFSLIPKSKQFQAFLRLFLLLEINGNEHLHFPDNLQTPSTRESQNHEFKSSITVTKLTLRV